MTPQPPGLQRDLLKCSRETREWVLRLANEIERLRAALEPFEVVEYSHTEDHYLAEQAVLRLSEKVREDESIVDKLPKTADGVPMVPGMEVWCIGTMRYNNGAMEELSGRTKEHVIMGLQRGKLFEGRLYSTREAAEKARES